MRLVNIENQTATVELAYYDCFRLARICDLIGDTESAVHIEFAEVYAAMFAAISMAAQLEADASAAQPHRSLEYMRDMCAPEDVRKTAD